MNDLVSLRLFPSKFSHPSYFHFATDKLDFSWTNAVDFPCFCHLIQLTWNRIITPEADEFVMMFNSLFTNSHSTRFLLCCSLSFPLLIRSIRFQFTADFGEAPRRTNNTRWFGDYEVIQQVKKFLPRLFAWIKDNKNISNADLREKFLGTLFPGSPKLAALEVELALLEVVGKKLYSAAYILEGDGELAFQSYELFQLIRTTLGTREFAQVSELKKNPMNKGKNLGAEVETRLKPALLYWAAKLGEHKQAVRIFEAARILSPTAMKKNPITAEDAAAVLGHLPKKWRTSSNTAMISELNDFLKALKDEPECLIKVSQFWTRHAASMPILSGLVKILMTIQPSSAAAERVFSRFGSSFNSKQTNVLTETIATSLMLQCNQ